MPSLYWNLAWRYGLAVLAVGSACVLRIVLHPVLGTQFPFFAFFVAIILTAILGGYGPSLAAVVLSWVAVDALFGISVQDPHFFQSRSQLAFAFLSVGLAITVLGGGFRAARRRARAVASDLSRAFATQQAEREWLQITLASIADAVITTDPQGRVSYLNPVASRLTGWSASEALGRPLGDVFRTVHGTTFQTDDLPLARVVDEGEVVLSADEVMLVPRRGGQIPVEHNAAPIRDAQDKIQGVAIVFRDITERRRAALALKESEERFHSLADATPVLIWGADTEKRCNYFNKQWLDFTGRSHEQEKNRGWHQGVHPDDAQRCLNAFVTAFDAREPFTVEYRLRRHDGQFRWMLDHGVPTFAPAGAFSGYIGSCLDITDRRQAEIRLRQSEERFRRIVETAQEGIWVIDPKGLTTFANARMTEMLGVPAANLVGRSVFEFIDPQDRPGLEERLAQQPQGETGVCDLRFRRADGGELWAIVSTSPYTDDRGRRVGILGMLTDITDRKRAEEELRQADRRKEEFLAVLSHELRNPLAPIQSSVDLLEQAQSRGVGTTRELAVIKRQVRNLSRLVDDLLDISRISRGRIELRKENVELADVAAHAVETVRPLLDELGHQLHIAMPSGPINLAADPTRLEQILANLLVNAAKYTPRQGRIWLSVETAGAEVVISVRDTGIGIEPELLPLVFDMFLKGERRLGLCHEGGGIGLSLARNLVELHGGTITAHSQGCDRGSEFVVRLPIRARTSPSPETPRAPTRVTPRTSGQLPSRRILIVDDNVQAADGLGRLMTVVLGQEVRVVYSGQAALEEADRFLPEIVLLDLEMAGMDGYEVAARLREAPATAHALLAAVTGWGHEEDRRRTRASGFALHMVKPVTVGDLRTMLAELNLKLSPKGKTRREPDLSIH